ncbi:hypothetical protein [Maribacter litoralis]|uniref:Beta-lactamase-inhibitor-like PepSY-like domain-containing protein n=1 Tax=Maribacter litoralis TaxID=2059726 RepID=A0A653PXI5_9FLAO|nr:hypothetical protein [Maribacter litoralis]VXB34519.1 conserved exported hypothetical protein [Maribacter litoralis]
MKTLFLLGAMTIGGFAMNAQDALLAENGIQHNQVNEMLVVADDFKEISVSEVPQAVSDAVAKNFPTASLDKAYTNEEKQYKLVLSLEDGTQGTVYADEDGNWIDM